MLTSSDSVSVDLIVVPQGAEYRAIQKGLQNLRATPTVVQIPLGNRMADHHLNDLQGTGTLEDIEGKTVVLLGLGGSLSPRYQTGDVVIISTLSHITHPLETPNNLATSTTIGEEHIYASDKATTHLPLAKALHQRLSQTWPQRPAPNIGIESGITSDRVITTPQEKHDLGQAYHASVVDMEGMAVLRFFQAAGAHITIVRVISDGSNTNIPDLNSAIGPEGDLRPGAMAWQFLTHPVAATHLIRGSLKGLSHLRRVAQCCATPTLSSTTP